MILIVSMLKIKPINEIFKITLWLIVFLINIKNYIWILYTHTHTQVKIKRKISGLERRQIFQCVIESVKYISQCFDVIETFLSVLFLAVSNSFRTKTKRGFLSMRQYICHFVFCREKSDKMKEKVGDEVNSRQ